MACAAVPDGADGPLKANAWLSCALAEVGGRGGGKPTYAQGAGTDGARLTEAAAAADEFAANAIPA